MWLAINAESAYQVCAIKNSDGSCAGSCSTKILYDTDGTKCVANDVTCATYDKLTLYPEDICILKSQCNSSIYSSNSTHCGLCRDLNSTYKYKFVKNKPI